MSKCKLIQTQYNGSRSEIIEVTVIDEFKTEIDAIEYLKKRDYVFDNVYNAYVRGNAIQYPVTIEVSNDHPIFDIRRFV